MPKRIEDDKRVKRSGRVEGSETLSKAFANASFLIIGSRCSEGCVHRLVVSRRISQVRVAASNRGGSDACVWCDCAFALCVWVWMCVWVCVMWLCVCAVLCVWCDCAFVLCVYVWMGVCVCVMWLCVCAMLCCVCVCVWASMLIYMSVCMYILYICMWIRICLCLYVCK